MRFSSIVPLAFVTMAACGGARMQWRPSLVSHVPDSTPVRFTRRAGEPRVQGRALDWQRAVPRVVTATGDTIVVPDSARLEVRLREKKSRATFGGVIGWAVGVGVMYANCPSPKRTCGEQDPTPVLVAGLGALIGSRFKADDWVRVRWPPSR
jgi:hypothetical protein